MSGMEDGDDGKSYGYRPKLVWNAAVQEYLAHAYGPSQILEICSALTRPCMNSTVRVNTLQANTQEIIEQLTQHFTGASVRSSLGSLCAEVKTPDHKSQALKKGSTPCDVHEVASFENVARPAQNKCSKRSDECESESSPSGRSTKSQEGQCSNAKGKEIGNHNFREEAEMKNLKISDQLSSKICWEHPELKDVIMVRGRGPYEVDCRDESGGPLKEVVVSRKCAEAVLRGANIFVPGVLASSLHIEKGDIVAVTVAVEKQDSAGTWAVGITRGTTLDSEHANSQMEGVSRRNYFIGKGRMTMSRNTLFRETKGVAVEMTHRIFDLPPFHGLLQGQIFLQNLPSIVAARVLDPKPGEKILDMCAAPGGKTTAIAMLMEDKGEIIALDRSHNKVLEIQRLSEEMKLTSIQAYKVDATKSVISSSTVERTTEFPSQVSRNSESVTGDDNPPVESSPPRQHTELQSSSKSGDVSTENQGHYKSKAAARKEARRLKNMSAGIKNVDGSVQKLKGFHPQSFDRVLLDAPCSALGLRPRLSAGEETLETLRQHSCYQRKMLDQAVQLVRPGGTLVYSTCTINPGENEAVVRYALDTYNFLSLMPQEPKIGGPGLVGGLNVFDGMSSKEWLREEEKHLVQRFSPCGTYDTIGFFIAKFAVAPKEYQGQVTSEMKLRDLQPDEK